MRQASALLFAVALLGAGGPCRASIWPTAERRAERELASADVLVRRQAARSLEELPPSAGRRLAQKALADADAEVKILAVRAAVALGAEHLGPRLATFLLDPDARLRLAAAEALAEEPSPAALPALARASSDADSKVRASVARALGASGNPDAVVALLGRLDDPAPDVRRDVVVALGHLGDRRAVVPLLAKVEDSAGVVRRAAARALGALGDARAVSALVLVLRDSDEAVRVAALEAVGRLGDASVVPSVAAELASDQPAVREAAALALGRLHSDLALTALVAELGRPGAEPEPVVRALGLAGPAALPVLRTCLAARAGVADGCARALAEVGDATDAARVSDALGRGALGPLVALPALARLGGPAAVPTALEYLASPGPSVRHAALEALAALLDPHHPDGRAVDPLLSALRTRGITLPERVLVLRLLGRSGAVRVAPELGRVATVATVPAVVVAALSALGDLGPGPWQSVVEGKLDDGAGDVRTAAAVALGRAASERTLPLLLDRLERGSEQDRGALGLALPGAAARARDPSLVPRLVSLLERSTGAEREPLLEALGELPAAEPALRALAASPDALDRAKVAEAVAGRADARAVLEVLAGDRDPRVRANAAWSLGYGAGTPDLGSLDALLADHDGRVAANAAVAVGRSAGRLPPEATEHLCARLADPRAIVRAAALTGLRLAGRACRPGAVERLLATDSAPRVRRAAATLLTSLPPEPSVDAALARCTAEEEDADVATACAARPAKPSGREVEPVLVFVVPTNGDSPAPGAPFALELADGSVRFGAADRRGAVRERRAPVGALGLGLVPGLGE